MVPFAAAEWCFREPSLLLSAPGLARGFRVNGAGREALCFPLTGCVNTDLLLYQPLGFHLSPVLLECSCPTCSYQARY